MAFDFHGDGIDGTLGQVEVLDGLGAVQHEFKESQQVIARGVGVADLELTLHPSTFLRRASSLF